MERRSPALQDTRDRIDECLQRARLSGPHVRVVPLTGDASTRQYFRILRPDNPSVVLAVYDAPFTFDELPFVNVCRLFTSIPLPIPAIAGHADDLGILILEDLGDVTLQAHLGVTQPIEHDALYKQAVELVFRMQRKGAELRVDEFIPYQGRVRSRQADVGAELLRRSIFSKRTGRVALRRSRATALERGWSPWLMSLPASRACSVTAIITAAI